MFDDSEATEDSHEVASDFEEIALEVLEVARRTGTVVKGTNETTEAVESGKAELIYIAENVQPEEIVMHLPELAQEKNIPLVFIPTQEKIGHAVGLEVGSAAAAITNAGKASSTLLDLISGEANKEKSRLTEEDSSDDVEFEIDASNDELLDRLQEIKKESEETPEQSKETASSGEDETTSAEVVEVIGKTGMHGEAMQVRCQFQTESGERRTTTCNVLGPVRVGDSIEIPKPGDDTGVESDPEIQEDDESENQAEKEGSQKKGVTDSKKTVGKELQATPHTFYQLPKNRVDAHFYYFTDESYTDNSSKFKNLDDSLTLLGRHRGRLEVAVIDRDRITACAWDALIEGFDLGDYPALVIAEEPLGIREVEYQTSKFSPNEGNYATLERGTIADQILQDEDKIRSFLNDLYDAARHDEVQSTMRKEKILNALTIGKKEIKSILSVQTQA